MIAPNYGKAAWGKEGWEMTGEAETTDERRNNSLVSPAIWVLVATLATSVLVLVVGWLNQEWRGTIITLVQVLVVGFVAYYGIR